jgi:hypothetical protein
MEKTTFMGSEKNQMKKLKRWLGLFSICLMFFSGQSIYGQDVGTIQIGTETVTNNGFNVMPVSNYNFNYSQQIITAGQYSSGGGTSGEITKIRYKINTVGTYTVWNNWRIFMGNTTKTAFTSVTDWIPMSELEEVFNGDIISVVPTAGQWIEITLTTPFEYTGGNFVIAIDENTPDWTTSPGWASFTSNQGAGLLFRSDNVNHDPTISNPPNPDDTGDFSDAAYVLSSVPIIQLEGTLADCIPPSGIVSSNITAYTADVSWDEIDGVEGYEYVLSTSNVQPTEDGTPTTDGNTYIELDELAPQTVYYVFVRTNCGSGVYSDWGAPISFKTLCIAATDFVENFESTTGANFPNCWANIGTVGNAYTQANTGISGSRNLYMYTGAVVSMTSVNNADAETHRMVMNVRANFTPGETIELGYLTDPTNASTFTVLNSIITNSTTVPQKFTTIPTGVPSGEVVFALRTGNAFLSVLIDDVVWEELPSCPDQTGLVVSNVTAHSAEMSWDELDGVEGYEYVVTTSDTPPVSGEFTEATYYSTEDDENVLTPQTTYYLHVRAVCSGDEFGYWATTSFRTGCVSIDEYPFLEEFNAFLPSECWLKGDSGDLASGPATYGSNNWAADGFANNGTTGSIAYNFYTTGTNAWIISPEFAIPAIGYELKFDAALTQWNGVGVAPTTPWDTDDKVQVLISTEGTTNWNALYTYDNTNPPAPTGEFNVIDLDDYEGLTVRFAFRVVSGATDLGDDTDFFIDNFEVRQSPSCPDQTGLVIGTVTATSADMSWDEMDEAEGYEYAVTTSATPPASGEFTLNPYYSTEEDDNILTPLTTYYLHVRVSCGDDNFGYWATTSFTTTCVAATIPYFEGFESGFTHNVAVAGCWSQGSVTGDQVWTANNTFTDYNRSPFAGSWNAFLRYGNEDWMFIPVQLEGGVNYELSFYARQDGATATNASVKASYGATNSIAAMTNPIIVATPIINGDYQKIKGVFTPTVSGVYFVGINGNINGSPWYISIDDISLHLAPTCPDVTGVVVEGVTYNSANMSWDEMDSAEEGYEYAVTTSATPPASGEPILLTYYDASGLASNTVHYLHVRAICSESDFGAWVTVSFTTAVAPSTIPWTEGFDASSAPGWLANGYVLAAANEAIGTWPYTVKFGDGTTNIVRRNPYAFSTTGSFTSNSVGVVSAGDILSFDYKLINYGDDNAPTANSGNYKVEISIDFGATYEEAVDTVVNDGVAGWQTKVYSLDDYEGEYVRVKITDTWTSGDYYIGFDNFYIGQDLSSPSFDKSALKVYPNPTKNILYVNYNQEISNVEIYNLVGQRVAAITPNANEGQVDMSNLASGAYFVKVTSNNTTKTVKVIKE